MKILIANLGSTSFKYRLFDMNDETMLARGGVERIGAAEGRCFVECGVHRREFNAKFSDHAEAVRQCLAQLTDPSLQCLRSEQEVAAIGFKAVHGGRLSGVQRVNNDVLLAMEEMNDAAPAHNPPYIAAMRLLHERLPHVPLVAVFETGFHETIPDRLRYYPVPKSWGDDHYVKRWGFHGASHRYIAGRTSQLLNAGNLRIVSCHLGGSNSLCAIRDGKSVATTMGMSPQTGLCHNNRVGDFDPFALPLLMRRTGKSLKDLLHLLAEQSGLLGLSGLSGDVRDLESAAQAGHAQARLALDVFISGIRQHLGAMLVELGGADAIVFTGGIGENSWHIREETVRGLEALGIQCDEVINRGLKGEAIFHAAGSKTQLWVVPTNEEIVVARLTRAALEQ